jgi:hypothetical protein
MADAFLARQTALVRARLRAGHPVARLPEAPDSVDPAAAAALVDFCLALFNRNAFLYVE